MHPGTGGLAQPTAGSGCSSKGTGSASPLAALRCSRLTKKELPAPDPFSIQEAEVLSEDGRTIIRRPAETGSDNCRHGVKLSHAT